MTLFRWFFTFIALPFLLSFHSNWGEIKLIGPQDVQVGAARLELYLPALSGKRVAIVSNPTSVIGNSHIVDSLLSRKVNLVKVFSPEHGFRGNAGAGEKVNSSVDAKTGLPIVSLYGSHKKPTQEDLNDVDIILFDIQDVGVRFYTYISTLQYVMESAAEYGKELIVLDRPNPLGHFVDGPVLKKQYQSFVGMQEVPIIHGMTIGEYALMLNGEGWLVNKLQCNLTVISVKGYSHQLRYQLPIAPSPNLPNMKSIYLYPSLCLFEGTPVSVGRGTSFPFQAYGHPDFIDFDTSFTPKSIPGKSLHPKLEGKLCKGYNLEKLAETMGPQMNTLNLFWLLDAYKNLGSKADFFQPFFHKLAGTKQLSEQIISGKSEEEIRASWANDLAVFNKIRKKYLLYEDFNSNSF
jgi:uncharacterized protein YbbC (DUF1343 family)